MCDTEARHDAVVTNKAELGLGSKLTRVVLEPMYLTTHVIVAKPYRRSTRF